MSSTKKIKDGYTSLNGKLVKDSDLPSWYADYRTQQREQKKKDYQMFNLKFNRTTDKDIIDILEAAANKTDFVRKAILFYVESQKQDEEDEEKEER